MKKLMAQAIFKPLRIRAAIASILTLSVVSVIKPAHAFSITSDFTVQITSDAYENQGLMNGTLEYGSFTYDNANLTGIGSESVSGSKGSLSLQFNFFNKLYTEQNDLNYGVKSYLYDYPIAFFADGMLLGLDFLVVPPQFQPPQNDLGFRIFKDTFYVGATDNFNSGTLAGTVTYGDSAAVPEPSEVGGAIVALGLGIWAMRKVKGKR